MSCKRVFEGAFDEFLSFEDDEIFSMRWDPGCAAHLGLPLQCSGGLTVVPNRSDPVHHRFADGYEDTTPIVEGGLVYLRFVDGPKCLGRPVANHTRLSWAHTDLGELYRSSDPPAFFWSCLRDKQTVGYSHS